MVADASDHAEDFITRMCQAGAGIAVLPCALAEALGGLRRVEMDDAPPSREVYVGFHEDLRRTGRVRAFLELVGEKVK